MNRKKVKLIANAMHRPCFCRVIHVHKMYAHGFIMFCCGMVVSPHYDDVIMSTIASQITSLTIVYSTIYSGADQSKHQSSASLAFVWGIHRGPVNSPHKWPVTRKMFPFDDVIMILGVFVWFTYSCSSGLPYWHLICDQTITTVLVK